MKRGHGRPLVLPARRPRSDDGRVQRLLPASSAGAYVDPADYLPILAEARPARNSRRSELIAIDGRPGGRVTKVFDSGRYHYGGPLQGLWVDQAAEKNFELVLDDPLSMTGSTRSAATLERPGTGWRARTETATRVWSDREPPGHTIFRYSASIRAFIPTPGGADELLEERTVEGAVARTWI